MPGIADTYFEGLPGFDITWAPKPTTGTSYQEVYGLSDPDPANVTYSPVDMSHKGSSFEKDAGGFLVALVVGLVAVAAFVLGEKG